jgi:hypothetical protein
MASDVRPPADNSHLHADPAQLARAADRCADMAFHDHDYEAAERHQRQAIKYRRLAAAGETIPNF